MVWICSPLPRGIKGFGPGFLSSELLNCPCSHHSKDCYYLDTSKRYLKTLWTAVTPTQIWQVQKHNIFTILGLINKITLLLRYISMAMIDVNRDAHLRLVSCYVDVSDMQEVRRTQHGVTLPEEWAWCWKINYFRMCCQFLLELLVSCFHSILIRIESVIHKTDFQKSFWRLLSLLLCLSFGGIFWMVLLQRSMVFATQI